MQARGDGGPARIGAHLRRLQQAVHPFGVAAGRLLRPGAAQAGAFQVDQLADALRTRAGVQADHVAAHAVAQQIDRLVRRIMTQDGVQVGQVVGEPIGVGAVALRQAKAAPVRCDHMPIALQRVHHELERGADIHPAMQHEQLGRALPAPVAHVTAQAANGQEFGTGRGRDRHVLSLENTAAGAIWVPCPSIAGRKAK